MICILVSTDTCSVKVRVKIKAALTQIFILTVDEMTDCDV